MNPQPSTNNLPDQELVNRVQAWAEKLQAIVSSEMLANLLPDKPIHPTALIQELLNRYVYWSQREEEKPVDAQFEEIRRYEFWCEKCETKCAGRTPYNNDRALHICPTCGTHYQVDTWIRRVRRMPLEFVQLQLDL